MTVMIDFETAKALHEQRRQQVADQWAAARRLDYTARRLGRRLRSIRSPRRATTPAQKRPRVLAH